MSSFFGPFLTLEGEFGSGFTSGSLADAILVAEQNESALFEFGVFAVDGISVGNLAFDVFQGLFLVSDPLTGQILHTGSTVEALNDSIERSRVLGLVGPPGPPGLPGTGADLSAINQAIANTVRNILATLGSRQPTTGGFPGLEPVRPGGSVNVPVVRGSTADPTGVLRPTRQAFEPVARIGPRPPPPPPAPPTQRQLAFQRVVEIIQLLLRQAQERALREAQRRARELQAQQLANFRAAIAARDALRERERRAAMGFGQAGFRADDGGGVNGGRDFLADALAALGGVVQDRFGRPFADSPAPGGNGAASPELDALLRGLGGGNGACPSLFRPGRVSSRPASVVCVPDPQTGEARFFGSLGTPLLFSRDVSAAKKVRKLAQRFARKG